MKKIWKWFAVFVLVLCTALGAIVFNVYSDIKSTAEEIYTPMQDEYSDSIAQPVNISSKEPFSALILGVDKRDNDAGRSDTMLVLTVNPTLETTKMLSIPRDTLTEIVGAEFEDKINHAYAFGGVEMAVATVENLLNIPIDYVAQIDMESFTSIIEIVGGITVENTLDFYYEGEHFPIGELTLDGEDALKYVRMRYDDPSGDFGRQNRQKQVIQGVLQKSLSVNTILNYRSILKTIEDHIEMNILFDELLNIRKNYGHSFHIMEQLYMNNGTSKIMNNIYYYMPNEEELDEIQKTLQAHLEI